MAASTCRPVVHVLTSRISRQLLLVYTVVPTTEMHHQMCTWFELHMGSTWLQGLSVSAPGYIGPGVHEPGLQVVTTSGGASMQDHYAGPFPGDSHPSLGHIFKLSCGLRLDTHQVAPGLYLAAGRPSTGLVRSSWRCTCAMAQVRLGV
jgi:hypothetical protein